MSEEVQNTVPLQNSSQNKFSSFLFYIYLVYNIALIIAISFYTKKSMDKNAVKRYKKIAKYIVLSIVILHFVLGSFNAYILVKSGHNPLNARYTLGASSDRGDTLSQISYRGSTLILSDISLLLCIFLLLRKEDRFESAITLAFFGNILCLLDYLFK